jgi:hypothetical protein
MYLYLGKIMTLLVLRRNSKTIVLVCLHHCDAIYCQCEHI